MRKIILPIVIILLLVLGIYQAFFKKAKGEFTLTEVIRGVIRQEISETGQVQKGEEIALSFKSSERIEKVYVVVGEEVKEGDILAKLEDSQLKIQLEEAKAVLAISQAKLNKLLAGASPEEIQILETSVENAKISLKSAEQNLSDIKSQGEENLSQAYEDAQNVLADSYLKIQNSFNAVDSIVRAYFISNDQEGLKIREEKDKIEKAMSSVKTYLDIDTGLSQMKTALSDVSGALKIIREICETPAYLSRVPSTDKTSLDTQRGYIITALTNVVNSQQTISSTKLTNAVNINSAQAKIDSTQGQLKAAEDELTKILAPPRQADIDLYQAQVKQAEVQISLLESQIEDTILKSPVSGQIIKIKKRKGEIVQPMLQDAVITLLPTVPFQIKVDIYEEDVVRMKTGNLVDISLVALPDQIFKGKIISIEPAEKLIEGVVYYEATIAFEETPEGLKPGMTADLTIKTAFKENVLVIPDDALQEKDGKVIVQVFEDGNISDREVETGLEGENDMVEVISGLSEGEKVILR